MNRRARRSAGYCSCDTVPLPEHEVGGEGGQKSMQEEGQLSSSRDTAPSPEHKLLRRVNRRAIRRSGKILLTLSLYMSMK